MIFISEILAQCRDWHDVRTLARWNYGGGKVRGLSFLIAKSEE